MEIKLPVSAHPSHHHPPEEMWGLWVIKGILQRNHAFRHEIYYPVGVVYMQRILSTTLPPKDIWWSNNHFNLLKAFQRNERERMCQWEVAEAFRRVMFDRCLSQKKKQCLCHFLDDLCHAERFEWIWSIVFNMLIHPYHVVCLGNLLLQFVFLWIPLMHYTATKKKIYLSMSEVSRKAWKINSVKALGICFKRCTNSLVPVMV